MRLLWVLAVAAVVVCLSRPARADVYLHAFRGSNNRLDEANRDRANNNRLFDSQNNNRGGYNVGSTWLYTGERMYVEWTNQHGCGTNPNVQCELVMQYMCDPLLRDGTTTNQIQVSAEADVDYQYGRHESVEWYQSCNTRQRNQGLFTASQNLNGNTAIYTRQNPNGGRSGLECPEERDYYPYWHPSPWKDALILTDQPGRNCEFYRSQSQNVIGKGHCFNNNTGEPIYAPNNAADCRATELDGNQTAVWRDVGAWGIDPPACEQAPWSRDNHLGNGVGGQPNFISWAVPNDVDEQCAFRMRYNISTLDYDGWDSRINATLNDRNGEKLMAFLGGERYGVADPAAAGYRFQNNPQVDPGIAAGLTFQLAVNTAQYGRTFQDRSHRFGIKPAPEGADKIVSLQVRGKRGNIVQTFPGVEYDFVPNELRVDTDTWIHIQWTGSNTNPANNDGQGRQQSDRSNIAQVADMGHTYPQNVRDNTMVNNTELHPYTLSHRQGRLSGSVVGGNMDELDDGYTFYDNGLVRFTKAGTYDYMCTRNNNFSNRGQKGRIIVEQGSSGTSSDLALIIGIVVGALAFIAIVSAIAIASLVYHRKQMRAHKRSLVATQEMQGEEVNPFSPMVEDSL